METSVISEEEKRKIQFKSYYVVWKLSSSLARNVPAGVFKSYYVVWKQKYNARGERMYEV